MTSSTSNFDLNLSVLTFLCLWVGYRLLIWGYGERLRAVEFARTTDRTQVSLDRLQSSGLSDHVVLGSSQTTELRLPDGWSNYGVVGRGARTGLALLRGAEKTPAVVVVEVNNLLYVPDQRAVRRVQSRFNLDVDFSLRPSKVLWSRLSRRRYGPYRPALLPPDGYGRAMDQWKQWSAHLDDDDRDQTIKELRTLKEGPAKVVFLLLPEDPELSAMECQSSLRRELVKQFPDTPWIKFDHKDFPTRDGRHLTWESSERLKPILKERLEELQRNGRKPATATTP